MYVFKHSTFNTQPPQMLSSTFINSIRTSLVPRIMDCGIKNEEIDESPNGTVTFTAVNPDHAKYFEAIAYGAGDGIMTSGRIFWGEFHVQIQMKGSNITAFIYQSDRESAQAEEFATLDAFFERVADQLLIE